MSDKGWIGFDLDGTLAEYDHWRGVEHIGAPIAFMVALARDYIAAGVEVRIFTARVAERDDEERNAARRAIEAWCMEHLGSVVPITNVKDFGMWALYDDRAIAVEKNTGRVLGADKDLAL